MNLERIADRWRIKHTVALAAWALVLILGLMLLVRNISGGYPATDQLKVYAAENATFTYPANWSVKGCASGRPFIELPGTFKTDYKGKHAYDLTVHGNGAFSCASGRPERFDLYPETFEASAAPCAPATSTRGERLQNGLYLQLDERGDELLAVHIRQNVCYAPPHTAVLSFAFADPKAESDDAVPMVKTKDFTSSRQYLDIRALAENIRY